MKKEREREKLERKEKIGGKREKGERQERKGKRRRERES